MASEIVKLKLRDMYAIKHALQNVVRQKNRRLEIICTREMTWNYDDELQEEIDRLDKDIIQEEALIKLLEKEIGEFKVKHDIGNFKMGVDFNEKYTRRFK